MWNAEDDGKCTPSSKSPTLLANRLLGLSIESERSNELYRQSRDSRLSSHQKIRRERIGRQMQRRLEEEDAEPLKHHESLTLGDLTVARRQLHLAKRVVREREYDDKNIGIAIIVVVSLEGIIGVMILIDVQETFGRLAVRTFAVIEELGLRGI